MLCRECVILVDSGYAKQRQDRWNAPINGDKRAPFSFDSKIPLDLQDSTSCADMMSLVKYRCVVMGTRNFWSRPTLWGIPLF